jgi:hypothetical protein
VKYIVIIFFAWVTSTLAAATSLSREPYLVYLIPQANLESLADQKTIVTDHAMFVYALEENEITREKFWIYNNKKEKKYLTAVTNIRAIDPDIALLSKESESSFYRATPDKTMYFQTNILLHFEQISMNSLAAVYRAQTNSANANRYELRTLYNLGLPIHFGLGFNFQSIYWPNGEEQERLSVVSIGPVFSYKLLSSHLLALSISASAALAPIAQGTSSQNTDNFYGHSFGVGMEADFPSLVGNFSLGTHIYRNILLLKNTTRTNLAINPEEYTLSSFGISVGYKFDWNL